MNAPGYGAAFKKAVLDPLTSVNLVGFGEVLPRFDNFVAIDPNGRRQVRHPGAAHHDVVGREREGDDPRHGGDRDAR